jgi:Ca2+-binding EF-hand superfamily protein
MMLLAQAFRLIDRDNKGYIDRADVYRILCTTNVQDLEYTTEQTKLSAAGGEYFKLRWGC